MLGHLLLPLLGGEPRVEGGLVEHLHLGQHLGVVQATQLGALTLVRPGPVGLEPGRRRAAGDGVDLAAQRGNPPRVHDVPVRSGDLEPDRTSRRRAQVVDRDDTVRVAIFPGELLTDHLDLERPAAGGGAGHVGDPRQLDEHEDRDQEEDHDRADGPGQLEPVGAVDLNAVGVAWAPPAPVADHERHQEPSTSTKIASANALTNQ